VGAVRSRLRRRSAAQQRWRRELDDELGFWRHYFESGGAEWPDEYQERLDPELELQSYLAELVARRPGPRVDILDVGAGPATTVGRRLTGYDLRITAVDALADSYRELLGELGVRTPVTTAFAETERLRRTLGRNRFDIAHARNTLDHSYDPVTAIQEMCRVVKPGGWLVLLHLRDEAERERYHGLHQWNLRVEDGDLVVWSPSERRSVSDLLGRRARLVRASPLPDGDWELAVFEKRASRPS
jgi:SAM-dependent methyltransferase